MDDDDDDDGDDDAYCYCFYCCYFLCIYVWFNQNGILANTLFLCLDSVYFDQGYGKCISVD